VLDALQVKLRPARAGKGILADIEFFPSNELVAERKLRFDDSNFPITSHLAVVIRKT
jgi:hypothetical protein